MLGITNVSNAPSIVLKNTVVSSWTSGSYNGYSYRGTIPISGVTADTIAEVTFSQAQADSGNYSSVCTTYDGGLYVYSKVNTTITIPSIIIHSIVETYYEMDNSPMSGSTKAVTSGGVYNALQGIPPTIVAYRPSATSFADTVTKIPLTKYYANDNSQYFTFENNGITIKKSGFYRIHFFIYGASSGASRIQASYGRNANYEYLYNNNYVGISGANVGINGDDVLPLDANDKIFLTGWTASSSVTFTIVTNSPSLLEIQYLGQVTSSA